MTIFQDILNRYLDALNSGFGLIGGDVRWLFNVLVMINVALSAMSWGFSDEPVAVHLARRVLFIGIFAWLIENWSQLTTALYDTFTLLGIKAGGGQLPAGELLDPGKIARRGLTVGNPIMQAMWDLCGPFTFYLHIPELLLLGAALVIVIAAFFILAIQAALAILLFKLGSLVTFVLVPFSLLNRTAFIAERPLGWVIAASVRIMLLAIVVGLGESVWGRLQFGPAKMSIYTALDVALSALLLLVLALVSSRLAMDVAMGTARLGVRDAAYTLAGIGAAVYSGRRFVSPLMPTGEANGQRIDNAGLSAVRAAASMAGRGTTGSPSTGPVPPTSQKPVPPSQGGTS